MPEHHVSDCQYAGPDDATPDRFIAPRDMPDDEVLADLIEADGRSRLLRGQSVRLERYLDAVPNLVDRSDPLDAAIDVTLRSLLGEGETRDRAIASLVNAFPALAGPIRQTAALNDAVWSTARLRTQLKPSPVRHLPAPFGPVLPDNQPRYELRELIGEGAFGQVFLAKDRQLSEAGHDATVAIKILSEEARTSQAGKRLSQEATKVRRIDHAAVVRVLDRGCSPEDEEFIVYEYVAGGDLDRWFRRQQGDIPVRQAVSLMAKVARGVEAAHLAGLVHCDLKPSNIMLTESGEPKVADFGIAVHFDDQPEVLQAIREATQRPLGNLAFISPEQYRAEPGAITSQSDVYALGGLLYFLLTRQLPNGADVDEIARTHDPALGRTEPPPLRTLRKEVDGDLEAICRRALEPQARKRHGSAGAFADDLEAWLKREPIRWREPSTLRLLSLWARRRPALAAALTALLLVSIGGLQIVQIMARQAQQRQHDAKLAQLELERIQERRSLAVSLVRDFHEQMMGESPSSISAEMLPSLWVVEWLYGPTVLGDGARPMAVWRDRIAVIEDVVADLRKTAGPDALQTLLWRTALSFWHIRAGSPEQALAELSEVLQAWTRVLPAEDPWLLHVRALEASAQVLVAMRKNQPFADPNALRMTLQAAENDLSRTNADPPLRQLIATCLGHLNSGTIAERSPGLLSEAPTTPLAGDQPVTERLDHPE